MPHYLFFNGQFLKNDQPLVGADNRGLRYGDGLFETLKINEGVIALANHHWQRLFGGLQALQFQCPSYFTPTWLESNIHQLCKKNGHTNARVRLSVVRGNGGLYDPQNHAPNCIIQSWSLPEGNGQLNENGLVIGIYDKAKKVIDDFSNIKTNNYLPYTMAALHAKQQRWNDALILNSAGCICDATIANVFIVKNEIVYTPPLTEGAIAGVMRRLALEQLPMAGFAVQEKPISTENIFQADEIFFTNAIYTLRWVQLCDQKRYSNKIATLAHQVLLKNCMS
jgi:branched-chain amino acid aminotransferase